MIAWGKRLTQNPRWPRVRAGLILLAIFVNVAEGCPAVPNIQPHHLQGPIGARELARWGERLRGLGAELSDEELAEETLAFSAKARELHAEMLEPAWPYFDLVQVHQKWSLFPIADPNPWNMHVEGRVGDGPWFVLYRPLGDTEFMADEPDFVAMLRYRRVRAHWNPGTAGPRVDYPRFVDWLATEIFARTDVDAMRVRYLRDSVPDPHGVELPEAPTWHFEAVREREAR